MMLLLALTVGTDEVCKVALLRRPSENPNNKEGQR